MEWTLAVLALAVLAELLHARRCRRIAPLAFGPSRRPRTWVYGTPALRVAACSLLTWGLITLWQLDPKVHAAGQVEPRQIKHLILVLDVSPSMYLEDAGPERKQSRRLRASSVVASLLDRLPMHEYRISLIAFYTDAKPLLQESKDREVLRHLLEYTPTYLGFRAGKTDLFAGLKLAAQTARKWGPGTASLIVLTDGMTVSEQGMPRMPTSVGNVVIVGIGDPLAGRFIDGHQSRQDVATLRQVATRLKGVYHNGNAQHLPAHLLNSWTWGRPDDRWQSWTRRELALAAVAAGAAILSLLPPLLHWFGSSWSPGVQYSTSKESHRHENMRRTWLAERRSARTDLPLGAGGRREGPG